MGNYNFTGLRDNRGNYIEGTLETEDGHYFGKFNNNKLYGIGKFIAHNGSVYLGNFINGLLNGKGKIVHSDNSFVKGYFKNGQLTGIGKIHINGYHHINKYLMNELEY